MTEATKSSNPLNGLLQRLRADGGRYLLSVGLTNEERDATEKPTYGGKATQRWLTDQERTALCQLLEGEHYISCEQHGLVPDLAAMEHKCYACELERLRAALRRAGVEAMGCSPAASSEFKTEALNSVIAICAAADQGYDVRGEVGKTSKPEPR